MNINGKHVENITCPKCRWRHPVEITCFAAGQLAAEAAAEREALREEFVEQDPADEIADLQRQLAEVTRERDEWRKSYECLQEVVQDIGRNLGAKVPYELVNEVARRRMAEIIEVNDVVAAARKLVASKGRYHTELNYKALVAALEILK